MQDTPDNMADPEVTTEPAPSESAPSPLPPPPQEDEGKSPTSNPPRGSSPPPQPKPQSASSLLQARRQLLAALRATDTTIERLDKLTTTAAGTERVLAVTGYLSHALHHLLASAPWLAFQTRLSLLARLRRQQRHLTQKSPSKPTPSAPSPPPPTTSPSTPNKPPLLALSSLMSETRYTLRLLGLLPLWTWGAATLRSPPQDRTLYILTLLQVLVNVIYQLLENGSYLAAKGILSRRFIDRWGGIVQWDLWSTRAWFGHIFLQFFVLARERSLRLRRKRQNQEGRKEGSAEADAGEIRAWRKSLVNNVCWAPLCLHWCFEEGIGFPEQLTGLVSFMAGAWEVWDSWGRTTT